MAPPALGGIPVYDRRTFDALLPGVEGEHPLHIPGDDHQAPFAADLVEAAQQKLPEPQAPI